MCPGTLLRIQRHKTTSDTVPILKRSRSSREREGKYNDSALWLMAAVRVCRAWHQHMKERDFVETRDITEEGTVELNVEW